MRIISAASAFPSHRYSQEVIAGALTKYWGEQLPRLEAVDRLHNRTGVDYRNLVLPLHAYERVDTWGKANNIWIQAAQQLGKTALCRAMVEPGIVPDELDALLFVSVTGISSPSIDAKLVNLLGLSPNIKRMPKRR